MSHNELATVIILHEYLLCIIDHIDFYRFINSLYPCFKMVSRNTIKWDIMRIYESQKLKYCDFLEKFKSNMAITINIWTSNNVKKGFMCIIAYYIDDFWILQTQILRYGFQNFRLKLC